MLRTLFVCLSFGILFVTGSIIVNQNPLNTQNYYESLYRNFIIETNRQKILESNRQNLQFTLDTNKFIQFTAAEFQIIFLVTKIPNQTTVVSPFQNRSENKVIFISNPFNTYAANVRDNNDLDIDWNRSGFVTNTKNQGGCGSCWAFSAVSDLESSYLLNGYQGSIDLSEQQLVDCASSFYNSGCAGGWMTNAFAYIYKFPITTQSAYPYTGRSQSCQTQNGSFTLKNLRSYWQNKNCQLLVDILQTRPLTVAVAADSFYWGFYKSGILTKCSGAINHGVVLTGVKMTSTQNYWIVKNSWGVDWGESGYLRIDRSQNQGNLCQICSYPQHSIV